MGHHGQPDHNDNKCYLRADAKNDILFDPLVGMNPAMKSLKGPQRFVREVGVNSMFRFCGSWPSSVSAALIRVSTPGRVQWA